MNKIETESWTEQKKRKWAVVYNDMIRDRKQVDDNKESSYFDQQIEV
jgi:hypothetical protein